MGISALLSGVVHSRRSARISPSSRNFVLFQRWIAILGEWSFRHRLTKSAVSQRRGSLMSVVQIVEPETDIRAAMREIGAKARVAAREVANAPAEKKNRALSSGARILRERAGEILAANELDCADARAKELERGLDRPADAQSGPDRGDRARARGGRSLARSGRAGARDLHPPQRPHDRARGDAARRRRRHLRKPA